LDLLDRLVRDVRLVSGLARTTRQLASLRPDSSTTFADRFEARVEEGPGRIALIQGDQQLTYAELDAAANRFARWARDQGIGRGDVVALQLGNRTELVSAWIGTSKLGAVAALINHHLRGNALAHCVDIAGARIAVVHAEFADAWDSARGTLTDVRAFSIGGSVPGAEPLDDALERTSPAEIDAKVRTGLLARDAFVYIYTSGTTGLPKAAHVSHLRGIRIAGGGIAALDLRPSDRMYVPLPLYHSAGGLMALCGALLAGGAAVIAPRFSTSQFWSDCVRHEVTTFQYIGELCRYLLNSPEHPDERAHQIRGCVGNGLRPDVWEPFQKRFAIPRIVEFYGATEGNIALMNFDGKVGAVGRMPSLLRRAMGLSLVRYDVERDENLRDENGFCIECEPGEVGEAIGRISSFSPFEGYTSREATDKKILRDVFSNGDRYFRTGDLLRMDSDGYFYFVDRIGDTFRWKGENVATSEVAEALSVAPGVVEANVYGVKVPRQEGRAGMAALVVDGDFDGETLFAQLERELPAYARPVFVRIRKELETTGTFKHLKVELVEEGFDPSRVADPLFFGNASQKSYVPLTAELYERIASGEVRL